MTLSEAISQRQAARAVKANRSKSQAAAVRVDEIAAVSEVGTDYTKVDRAGDVAIEGHFQNLYQLVDSKEEKDAVLRAYLVWVKAERNEDAAVSGAVTEAVETLKANNPFWLQDR